MGRWDYGPWFWPPFTGLIAHGPVPNPTDPAKPWRAAVIPGTPNPSIVPEAFMDTPDRQRHGLSLPHRGAARPTGSGS